MATKFAEISAAQKKAIRTEKLQKIISQTFATSDLPTTSGAVKTFEITSQINDLAKDETIETRVKYDGGFDIEIEKIEIEKLN